MKLDIQAICHKGMVRANNEDAISVGGVFLRDDFMELSVSTPEEGFFYLLVSDGMGGHEKGEEASRFTLTELQEEFNMQHISPDSFEEDFRQLVGRISTRLNADAAGLGQEHPMGCTLSGVVWHYGNIWSVNAGDSRTYRFRGGMLRQLTTDDNERGITGDPEASKLLLNCIGGGCNGTVSIDNINGKILPGDMLLICSDGLSDMVSDEDIESILSEGAPDVSEKVQNSQASAIELFRTACENGGADNISIILATVREES